MNVVVSVEKERLEWRDNLLSRYEARMRELEKYLEIANYYVVKLPQTEHLKEKIASLLKEKV